MIHEGSQNGGSQPAAGGNSGSASPSPVGASSSSSKPQTNLFINYLPPELDDVALRKLFEKFGHIENCKVLVDLSTGQSKCFGFVKYRTRDEAEAAIGAMSGAKLAGYGSSSKTLVVKFAETTNDSIGTPSNNLYVKNLPLHITTTELEGLFSPYGKIVECKLLRDAYTNTSRGMAFVRYSTLDEARNAIASLNNYVLGPAEGQPQQAAAGALVVKFADTEDERSQRKSKQQRRRLAGPPRGAAHSQQQASQQLADAPAAYYALPPAGAGQPPPPSWFLMPADGATAAGGPAPPHFGMAYGYGAGGPMLYAAAPAGPDGGPLLAYDQDAVLSAGLAALALGPDGQPAAPTHGRAAAPHSHGPGGSRGATLFVYNVADGVDEALLSELFGRCGRVVAARVARDKQTHSSRGYAFVDMGSPAEAMAAIQMLNGYPLHQHTLSVSFKK